MVTIIDPKTEERSMLSDRTYLIKGSILNLVGLVLRNISPVFVIVLARLFPKEVFGVFISVQLFALTASRLLVMGFDKGMIWYVPQNRKHNRPIFSGLVPVAYVTHLSAFAVWLLSALFLGLGGWQQIPALSPVSPLFVVACLFSVVPYMALHTFAAALEGLRLPEYKLLVNQFLAVTLGPLIAIALYFVGVSDISLAIGYTTANLLGAGVLLWIVNRRFLGVQWFRTERISRELWRYSWPLGLSEAIAGILLRVDLWMVLLLLGPADAAVYAIMVTLSNGLKSVRQNFDPLIVPIVSQMKEKQRRANLKKVHSYAVNMVTAIQLLAAVTVLFFPIEIMSIAGTSYTVQPQALSILLLGNLVNGFLGLNGQVLLGLGKSRFILGLNSATLLLNVLLNLALIPTMGISGAATATVLAYFAQCLTTYAFQIRLTGCRIYEPHLVINALLILVFGIISFGFHNSIIELPLLYKIAGFIISMMGLGGLFVLKRNSFTLASS